jgi:two-component system response regulator HydG
VETADNGVSALEKYRKNHYDITLMDIVMPEMNGVETFRRIREIDPRARVILMTAYYDDEEIRLALQEGAYNAINKPVDIAQLMGMIKAAMEVLPILIVDDDTDFCRTIARALELKGHQVITVSSGKDAIRIASEKKVQIAFIDVRMPLMNGLETYLRLKKVNPGIRAVMMTAYRNEMRDTIKQALAAEVKTCLYKPFNPEEILDLVHKMEIK